MKKQCPNYVSNLGGPCKPPTHGQQPPRSTRCRGAEGHQLGVR